MNPYAALLINAALCALVATILLFMSRILGRRRGSTVKYEIFETGNPPIGSLRGTRFPVKFYLTAILFVVFDIEAVLIYPWTTQFTALGWAGLATTCGCFATSRFIGGACVPDAIRGCAPGGVLRSLAHRFFCAGLAELPHVDGLASGIASLPNSGVTFLSSNSAAIARGFANGITLGADIGAVAPVGAGET